MLRYIIFILLFNTICFADKNNVNKNNGNGDEPPDSDTLIKIRESPNIESTEQKSKSTKNDLAKHQEQESTNITNKIIAENKNKTSTDKINSLVNHKSIPDSIKINNDEHSKDPWAAALRGFYVFLGLSIIIIVYFIIKSFR